MSHDTAIRKRTPRCPNTSVTYASKPRCRESSIQCEPKHTASLISHGIASHYLFLPIESESLLWLAQYRTLGGLVIHQSISLLHHPRWGLHLSIPLVQPSNCGFWRTLIEGGLLILAKLTSL